MLSIATQGIFVLLFGHALVNLLRYRDRSRLEVAALVGVLAIVAVMGDAATAVGVAIPKQDLIVALLLVAQPYLFLRLIDQFQAVPQRQLLIGLACLFVSWALLVARGMPPSALALVVVVVLFLYVEGYAIVTLIRATRRARGVARRRLAGIITGSALIALVVLLAGISIGWPGTAEAFEPVEEIIPLGAAISYYLGFIPPRRLRRLIQMGELGRHMELLANQPAEARLTAALDHMGPAATRAIGGTAAVVALGQAGADTLRIYPDPTNRDQLEAANIATLQVGSRSPDLTRAWRELRPVTCGGTGAWDEDVTRLANALGGARACLIAPLIAQGTARGVIIVFQNQRTLFLEDDLALLTMLADQAVLALESSRLFQESQQELATRQAMLDLSQDIADEIEARAVAGRLATEIGTILPSDSACVLFPLPSGELEIVATLGADADKRYGARIAAGAGVTGHAFSSGAPVVVDDVHTDPRPVAPHAEICSELAVPLRYRDTTVGVLSLERAAVAGFAPADVALAQIVAAHAAQAIARAQLLEQLRQQNIELQAANRHKGEFLANMSHELRTPLNAIIGFSELLLDEPAGAYDPDSERQFLESIHDSGQHLLSLINDILDLAKIEAGHMTLNPEPMSVPDLVAQALTTLRPLADRTGITLQSRGDEGVEIMCDVGKVKQILYNLLSNAIKFTPQDGAVIVTTRQLPDGVQLTVADTGIGISSNDQDRIFQEFQQIDTGAARHYEGTGLGLALTKRFVEMHEGRIWVESTPGEGSQFHVVLPAGRTRCEHAADVPQDARVSVIDPSPSITDVDRPRVLVIEDDLRAANLLTLYLERGGYHSVVVADGEQALDRARALQPAAIILDVLLPTVDGWEVLRQLKLDETTRDIPVVIASIVDDQELGFALGATDYFVKPVDRKALLARLDRYTFTTKVQECDVNVLLVDDEPASVELLAGMLTPFGFRILRAHGGASAITMAAEHLPDLILLDLMMPEVSGFDVVDALRANPATRHIPVLIVTAKELTSEDKQRLSGHVTAILQKGSFAAVDLIAWLDNALRQLQPGKGEPDDE